MVIYEEAKFLYKKQFILIFNLLKIFILNFNFIYFKEKLLKKRNKNLLNYLSFSPSISIDSSSVGIDPSTIFKPVIA